MQEDIHYTAQLLIPKKQCKLFNDTCNELNLPKNLHAESWFHKKFHAYLFANNIIMLLLVNAEIFNPNISRVLIYAVNNYQNEKLTKSPFHFCQKYGEEADFYVIWILKFLLLLYLRHISHRKQ